MSKQKEKRLPEFFRPLMWSYKFSDVNLEKDQRDIIVNSVNYGDLEHWQWLVKTYGKEPLKKRLANIPFSEFRPGAVKLISLLLNLKKLNYALRSDYIRNKKTTVRINQI